MRENSPPLSPDDPVFPLLVALVAVHYGEKARIRTVRLAPEAHESEDTILPWALEGRRSIYASHRVR